MSQVYAWPATWRGDGDHAGEAPARRAANALGEIAPALVLGGFPQTFDFFACGIAALAVMPRVYFAALGPAGALLAGLAVWLLAYVTAGLARPAAAALGRRWDPRVRLGVARLLFTAATVTVAVLPAAREAAWAPFALILARGVQGLGLAGLVHPPLVAQMSPADERRARRTVWAVAGAFGLLAAVLVMGGLALMVSGADFIAWGWRYPFVIALALNISGFVGDLYAEAEANARRGRPQLRLVAAYGARVEAGEE